MDIVERLRDWNKFGVSRGDFVAYSQEAADEIEQLREKCDRMASLAIDNAKDTERAMRLRKALREIYEVYAGSEGIPQPMTAAEGYLLFLLKETAKIAQDALEEKE
jgi:hypothetical protein